MTDEVLRLVHASDFHLECPLYGLDEIPEHLRELALDAPYLAAEQVFETALARDAALVVLAGDVVDPRAADPRAAVFLARQFARLAERHIDVYWAGGPMERGHGDELLRHFPDNVHRFPTGRVGQFIHDHDGQPAARLLGFSSGQGKKPRVREATPQDDHLPTIGVGHGAGAGRMLPALGVDYAAVGGRHNRQQRLEGACRIQFPGSPQGRCPRETGPHGCTMVELDADGPPRITFVATDVVRWVHATVDADACADRDQLRALMEKEMERQREEARGLDVLVSWTVAARAGRWAEPLRQEGFPTELCGDLRRHQGHTSPAAWSVSVAVDGPEAVPIEACQEETILGDFLRTVREYQTDAARSLALDQCLPDDLRSDDQIAAAARPEGEIRQRVLDRVARLGTDLLGH